MSASVPKPKNVGWSYFFGPLIDILKVYSTNLFPCRSSALKQRLAAARDRFLTRSRAAPGGASTPRPSNLVQESLPRPASVLSVACSTPHCVRPSSAEWGRIWL